MELRTDTETELCILSFLYIMLLLTKFFDRRILNAY